MAADGGMFESSRSIEEKRESKRRARQELLSKAKDDYSKAEKRKEQQRLRGEDTWMLDDVNDRLEALNQEHSAKNKKKKEKHRHKLKKEKKKKSKKQKSERNDDSEDSSSDSEEEWVEAPPLQAASEKKAWKIKAEVKAEVPEKSTERDEWMTLDFMSLKATSAAAMRAEKQKEKTLEHEKAQAAETEKLLSRELNPYWKDGGTGLPPKEGDVTSVKKLQHVEDGGLSWLRKSYQRMKEQSERENRSLDDIVAERYGSMEDFQRKLEAAEQAASQNSNDGQRERWKKSHSQDDEFRRYPRSSQHTDDNSRPRHTDHNRYNKYSHKESQEYKHSEESSRYRKEPEHRRQSFEDRNQDKSVSFKPKNPFLKPSDDDGRSLNIRDYKSLKNKVTGVQDSSKPCFQKPLSNEDEISWKKVPSKDCSEKKQQQSQDSEKPFFHKPSGSEGELSWKKIQPKYCSEKKQESQKEDSVSKERKGSREQTEPDAYSRESQSVKERPQSPSLSCRPDRSPQPIRILSDEEMNKLGAKIVKAELLGNMDLASKLRAQLEEARQQKERKSQGTSPVSERRSEAEESNLNKDNEVLLVRTDQSGRAWPVNAAADSMEPKGGRRKRQMVATHVDKERVRYFHDDDNQSLQDMVKREKMGTSEDQNKQFLRMASKFMEKTDRDYYTLDDMFVTKAAKKEHTDKEEERERMQAMHEHRSLTATMEKCRFCFDNAELPKHLIVAIGTKVYLCLPNHLSLTEGHCLIVPLQHHTASTLLDEDIYNEIQVFRKALVRMFESKGLDCVFLESNIYARKRLHLVYECIPLPKEVGDMAPIYFKKAIMESDEEWSMNKKLIDLSTKDIRRAVPKGLPYFSVDFGLQGGYAHVIEDEHKFPSYFGKEIIGGMLDLEPRIWRKAVRERFEDQRKKVLEFAQWWKPFDVTKE
ncbi:CWF19-like protein 2 isoform X1 [Xenopus tropicalis]|uniref:CWF19-like protein 2 n=1 Tax=Xenopus tropicalis TaxID=8364 RepID=F6R2H1_XENTR|nr:CWF19-like protein 2 isoform X1 [Xenopus tropicalis]